MSVGEAARNRRRFPEIPDKPVSINSVSAGTCASTERSQVAEAAICASRNNRRKMP
jgi:hypothetical protein